MAHAWPLLSHVFLGIDCQSMTLQMCLIDINGLFIVSVAGTKILVLDVLIRLL